MNAPLFTLTLAGTNVRVTPLLLVGLAAALILACNAALLVVAPTHRDRLPRWLRAPVAFLPSRYGSGETRITGLLVLGMLSWVVYDMLSRPH